MTDVIIFAVIAVTIPLIVVTALVIGNRLDHVRDFHTCKQEQADRAVYHNQMMAIFESFCAEVSKALEHEKDVLTSLKPESAGIVLVQYPQLQGINTILSLLSSIKDYQEKMYRCDLEYNRCVRRIHTRQASPLLFFGVGHFDVDYKN